MDEWTVYRVCDDALTSLAMEAKGVFSRIIDAFLYA